MAAVQKDYVEAVEKLNTLQTNSKILENRRTERQRNVSLNVPNMVNYLERIGLTMEAVREMKIIHVAGTKGKGSTCAYSESILRQYGYKTGLFSSPHLVEVRERIRISGKSLETDKFSTYFWEVYNKLNDTKEAYDDKMPHYFAFLTVMSLYVFQKEKVDAIVFEVGIGGENDSTNVIPSPIVCGVTSLGLDHTSILGLTLDKIAWHKAGIFKAGAIAYTVPQPTEAMIVLEDRAAEKGIPLFVCPDIKKYDMQEGLHLGITGGFQSLNASLALQLCHAFLKKIKGYEEHKCDVDVADSLTESKPAPQAAPFPITPEMKKGLETCRWLGRNQKICTPEVTYYLDGAHTAESIQQCVDWYTRVSKEDKEQLKQSVWRVMIFNTTGERDVASMMRPLLGCGFNKVLFCPNVSYQALPAVSGVADQINYNVTPESQRDRCDMNRRLWDRLYLETIPQGVDGKNVEISLVFPAISDCIEWLTTNSPGHVQLLVTGSSHLVGGVFKVLQDMKKASDSDMDIFP